MANATTSKADLSETSKFSLSITKQNKIYLFHETELPEIPNWAEYDHDTSSLCLIYEDGIQQNLGITVNKTLQPYFQDQTSLFLIHRENGEDKTIYEVPLMIRHT